MFTLIWWDPCHPPKDALTSSLWWIATPGGQRQFHCQTPAQRPVLGHSSVIGLPALVSRQICLLTGVSNSPLSCGLLLQNSMEPSSSRLQLIIHRQMDWWNAFTDTSSWLCMLVLTGPGWLDELPWVAIGDQDSTKGWSRVFLSWDHRRINTHSAWGLPQSAWHWPSSRPAFATTAQSCQHLSTSAHVPTWPSYTVRTTPSHCCPLRLCPQRCSPQSIADSLYRPIQGHQEDQQNLHHWLLRMRRNSLNRQT